MYKEVKKDPTKKIERTICETLKTIEQKGEIDAKLKKRISPQNSYLPQLFGLPKIHKPEVPLRPIVSSIGSVTYDLAKELTRILSPLRGKTSSYVKDSGNFIQIITQKTIQMSDIMVSFDVKSLFTKVPMEESLQVIKKLLIKDETLENRTVMIPITIVNLVKLCMSSTYFEFGDKIYEQTDGAPMGSPLSPVIADIYMEYFEDIWQLNEQVQTVTVASLRR